MGFFLSSIGDMALEEHFRKFAKGGWENDETVKEAAIREAIEEAGVRGDLVVRWFDTSWAMPRTVKELMISWKSRRRRRRRNWNVVPLALMLVHFLGHYFFKSKTLQDEFSPEGLCRAAMFALLVKEQLECWPEQSLRKRSWLTVPEAIECCRHPWMRQALEEGFLKWHDSGMTSTMNCVD
ncbi:Nudix hydrolase 16, mitochondrial [Capsicum chinense]|nr:Nudix hydrolase 16, mitochondrial [Capsicum chinense]